MTNEAIGSSPAIIVNQSEQDTLGQVEDEAGFIAGYCHIDGRPVSLESYQVAFLRDRSAFRWVTKSRQVGFSFVMALEALARCQLRENYTAVFVSYNMDDAKEKVLLARQIYDELPSAHRKKLVVDTKSELEFESNSSRKTVSRIVSVPSKAPRGKHGDVYLDELAHIVNDREVFTGSSPLVLRAGGQLTGCSTPLGRRGVFWEVATQETREYPNYSRRIVPWWLCRSFCAEPAKAVQEAHKLTTEEMVSRFGLPSIAQQLETLGLEDFEQEFCARFVDETASWYPYDLILANTSDDVVLAQDFTDIPVPTGRLVAGFDVGRTRDFSELAIFEQQGERFICRMLKSYEDVPFARQESELRRLLNLLPIARLSIDNSGIGMNLAENLAADFPQVVRENFTAEAKERWATDFKILLQKRLVDLPKDRGLVSQIHSIKRRVLASGNVSFEAERTARGGHADRYWAVAIGCQKERGAAQPRVPIVTARIIGTREENLREARREAGIEEVKKHPWEAGPVSEEPVWIPQGSVRVCLF